MTWKVLTSGTPFNQCLKTFNSNLWKIGVSILSSQKTLSCHVLTILFERISTAQTNVHNHNITYMFLDFFGG